MITFEQAINIIEKEIQNLNLQKTPANLYEPIKFALSGGGKRIRPALTIISCNLFNDDYKIALFPALAIEIFHNFTLIHDDLMDNSSLRRNKPTVHVNWNPNIAILAGDAMNILAYKMVNRIEKNILPDILGIFNETAIQVCEGQMMDMDYENRNDVTEEQYLQMIGLKTSVLLAACLKIGSIIGGADNENANTLYNFGYNLGLAFQLQDDLLDTFGNEKIFGKKIGNDIVNNKKTYLYIKSLELSSEIQRNKLKLLYSSTNINNEEKISNVKEIFRQVNINTFTEQIIHYYFNLAINYLEKVNVKEERKIILKQFAQNLLKRDS